MQQFISKIKRQNKDLKEAEIEGLLYIINSKENLTNNDLVKMTGVPKTILKEFKSSLADILKPADEDNIELSEEGLGLLSQLDLTPYKWSLVRYELKEYEDKIRKMREKYQLTPERKLDQFFATPESTAAKAKLLIDKGMVEGKKIALIGDDDLVSAALALMSPDYLQVKVFELDERLIETLKKIISDYNFKNLEVEKYDAREDLPAKDINSYDVVLIDPPYTKPGVETFLHRAVELLKKVKHFDGSYIFLNFGYGLRNPNMATKIQSVINQYNLVIEDKILRFSRYEGAETVGNASSIYVLKATLATSAEGKILSKVIYTFEKTDQEKFPYVDHYVFKLQYVSDKITKSKSKLSSILGQFCKIHRLKVVDTKISKFKGQGFSFTYILSTSNLIMHTWPEKKSLHLDLITCSPIYNKEKMGETLQKLFETSHIEIREIE